MNGFFQWLRPFIPNLSEFILPLTKKLSIKNKFTWTADDSAIVKDVYEIIKANILLAHPDLSKPFEVYTDASEFAMSGILKQGKNIIGIFSYKLKDAETRYTIVEKEICQL